MSFDQCPGCGHHYGRVMSSTPNEHGYCRWCREEGVHDKESDEGNSRKWREYHAEQERKEDYDRRMEENASFYGGW